MEYIWSACVAGEKGVAARANQAPKHPIPLRNPISVVPVEGTTPPCNSVIGIYVSSNTKLLEFAVSLLFTADRPPRARA